MKRMQKMFPIIEKLVDFNRCKTLIDIGCGSASLLTLVNNTYKNIKCTGVDFSDAKLNFCAKVEPGAEYLIHDIYNPLKAVYDYAFCLEVLEHLEYPLSVVRGLAHSVYDNRLNMVMLTVPNGRIDSFPGHIHFWSPESWRLFLSEVSIERVKINHGTMLEDRYNYAIISKA
jgi:2-polyprenyl-3-methyl-5-hydroxy-6-metoxy-1,4-benzoquinol methylase